MEEAIKKFTDQFAFKPVFENGEPGQAKKYFLCGMGGSHLAAHLIRGVSRGTALHIRSDYGLPEMDESEMAETLFIASSYSGNTEEVISFAEEGIEKGVNLVVVTTGGALLDLAKNNNIPYVLLPNTGIQPRMATVYFLLSLAFIMHRDDVVETIAGIPQTFDPESFKPGGYELAQNLFEKIPLIYSSTRNKSLAYNWKIIFNETGKIPAFYNVFPELNHNEMTGFDVVDSTRALSEKFVVVMIADRDDHPQNQKRMELVEKMYEDRGIEVIRKELIGSSQIEKYLGSIITAAWTALELSEKYGTEADEVPMIEEFKKQL